MSVHTHTSRMIFLYSNIYVLGKYQHMQACLVVYIYLLHKDVILPNLQPLNEES